MRLGLGRWEHILWPWSRRITPIFSVYWDTARSCPHLVLLSSGCCCFLLLPLCSWSLKYLWGLWECLFSVSEWCSFDCLAGLKSMWYEPLAGILRFQIWIKQIPRGSLEPSKSHLLEGGPSWWSRGGYWEEKGCGDFNSLLFACYRTWNKSVLLSHVSVFFKMG